jgi:hypothetical protein
VKKVTLYFPDIYLLWAFARSLGNSEYMINSAEKKLTCICNEENIFDALANFRAKIVEVHKMPKTTDE